MKALTIVILLATIIQLSMAQHVVHERIFVHTDRNYYHTGEVIWFRVYNVDVEQQMASPVSKIAYTELLDSLNRPVLQAKLKLDSGAANGSFMIPASVASGIYTFRCYTNWMKNFGAETFFTKHIAIVNAANGARSYSYVPKQNTTGDAGLIIEAVTDKSIYQVRESVSLTLATKNRSGQTVPADLSVSVYRIDSLISADESRITTFFSHPTLHAPDSFPYPPEYLGHMARAKIINRNTRLPARNIAGFLTVMDDGDSFYNGMTDARGNIQFLVTKLNPADSIIVQTHATFHPDHQIDLENPYSTAFITPAASSFIATSSYPSTVLEQSINAQVTSLYYEEELNRFVLPKTDSTPFYEKSDMQYELDNFTRFSKLEDVFREYIRPVGVTKRQGNFHLTVFSQANRYIIDQQPLVLVDAVPVFNTNALLDYDPLKIKTIDIVTSRYFRSGSAFQGVVNLRTYKGRTDGQLIDPNASIFGYEIVQDQRKFFSPSHENGGNVSMPDFRTTLFWEPSVTTGAGGTVQLRFYTGDLKGKFFVAVQGASAGSSGSAFTTFTVH